MGDDYRRRLAYAAGKRAALNGKSRETCDRQCGTIFFDDWHDGYGEGEQVAKIGRATNGR